MPQINAHWSSLSKTNQLSTGMFVGLATRPLAAALGNVAMKAFAESSGALVALASSYMIAAVLLLFTCRPWVWIGVIRAHPWLSILRVILMLLSSISFTIAILRMPLANSVGIVQITPILTAVISSLLGRERLNRVDWVCLATSVVGVLLIIRPTIEGDYLGYALAISASAMTAVATVATSDIAHTQGGLPTAVATTVMMAITLCSVLAFTPPTITIEFAYLAITAAACLVIAEAGLIMLLARIPASIVVSFHYLRPPWVIILAYFSFGEVPAFYTVLGITVIMGSLIFRGAYNRHRANMNNKSQRQIS